MTALRAAVAGLEEKLDTLSRTGLLAGGAGGAAAAAPALQDPVALLAAVSGELSRPIITHRYTGFPWRRQPPSLFRPPSVSHNPQCLFDTNPRIFTFPPTPPCHTKRLWTHTRLVVDSDELLPGLPTGPLFVSL